MKHPQKEHHKGYESEKLLGGTEGQRQAFQVFRSVWRAHVASFIEARRIAGDAVCERLRSRMEKLYIWSKADVS
jgi:hypothetical protein